jgi:hypothetical protein
MLTTNLHYARALLDPYLLGEVYLHDDANAKEVLNKVLWKIVCTPIAYALVLKKIVDFVKSQGPFSNTPPIKDLDLFPHEWWDLMELVDAHLHPLPIAFWHKCVSYYHVSKIGIHVHLSIAKCEIN